MKGIFLLLIVLLRYPFLFFGQSNAHPVIDSLPARIEKRLWIAAAENFGVNIFINRFDANVRNIHWAKVTPSIWKKNLSGGFQTDYDHFTTNWLGHPVHGSLFFNAARSNGYNYWQSIPFVVGGTVVWEYFGETYYASKIDLLTTSLGGIYLGEITHRIGIYFQAKKKKTLIHHGVTAVLDPISKINHWLLKPPQPTDTHLEMPVIKGRFIAGGSFSFFKKNGITSGARGYLGISFTAGDIFSKVGKKYKPFDHFVFNSWVNFASRGKDSVYFNISSHAAILAKHLTKNAVVSLSQHYDCLASNIFKIGSVAVTGDYSTQHKWDQHHAITGSLKAGVILFGSSKSEIVKFIYQSTDPEFLRDYIYGKGFIMQGGMALKTKKWGKLVGNSTRWVIYTDSDTKGVEDIWMMELNYDYPIWKKLNVGLQASYFKRVAHYDKYPNFNRIKNDYYEMKTMISLSF